MCLWKLKSLSKMTPRLRTLLDGDISLSSNLTGKWLESLCRCWFVPIIINSVLSEFNLSLLVINTRALYIQTYSSEMTIACILAMTTCFSITFFLSRTYSFLFFYAWA